MCFYFFFQKLKNEHTFLDDQLYTELLKSSEALEALLTDLKEYPKKYVHFSIFGKNNKSTSKK